VSQLGIQSTEFKALTRRIRSPKMKLRGLLDIAAQIIYTVAIRDILLSGRELLSGDRRWVMVSFGTQLDLIYSDHS